MDQFPLGKGKSVVDSQCDCQHCIVPLYKHWCWCLEIENFPHFIAFSHPATLFFHASCDLARFPKHTAELVMGLTEAAKT